MNKRTEIRRIFRTMAMAFLVLSACTVVYAADAADTGGTTMPEVRQKVDDALDAIKSYSIDKKDQAMAKAKEVMDETDARINELEKRSAEQWQQMSEAGREKSQQALQKLRKQRNDLAEWYGGMKESSKKAWGDVKYGFIKSYHNLSDAFEKASQKF